MYIAAAATSLAGAGAAGQTINVDFGASGGVPGIGYAGAGAPGVWNTFEVIPGFERRPLVGVHGTPLAARIYQFGGTAMLHVDDPATEGDHAALIDDMLLSFNNPTDACVWVENLRNGPYEVIVYAITPSSPGLQCRTTVDFAQQGPAMVGGAWAGSHAQGVSYSRFTVNVVNGRIGLHSGLPGSQQQSGINGFQIRAINACPADWTDDGAVNSSDISLFLTHWLASVGDGHLLADFGGDGAVTSGDISAYLTAWLAAVEQGC